MKRTISILVLLAILCSSLSSCKKENVVLKPSETRVEDSIGPNDGKAKSAPVPEELVDNKTSLSDKNLPHTNIVLLDTKTKTKQIVSSFPLRPEDIIISPDQRKMAFMVDMFAENSTNRGVYIMNIDGTNLINLFKSIEMLKEYSYSPDFCFSPDSQQLALKFYIEKNEEYIIYMVSLNGDIIDTIQANDPNFILMNQLFFGILESLKTVNSLFDWDFWNKYNRGFIKDNPETWEYLLREKNNIGIYSWKTRSYTPIPEIINPDNSFSWTPDRKNILYSTIAGKQGEKAVYDFKIFDTIKKTTKTIISNTTLIFATILWAPDFKSFIYTEHYKTKHPEGTTSQKYDTVYYHLKKFDISTKKSTLLLSTTEITALKYLSDQKILIKNRGHESLWFTIFNLQTQKEEKYPTPDRMSRYWEPYVFNHDLIILGNNSFLIYDTLTYKVTTKFDFMNEDKINETIMPPKFWNKI